MYVADEVTCRDSLKRAAESLHTSNATAGQMVGSASLWKQLFMHVERVLTQLATIDACRFGDICPI